MTRVEFCKKMADLRKASNVKMKDICFSLDMMPAGVYRMESGKHNVDASRIIHYLQCINQHIVINTNNKEYTINDENQLHGVITDIRHQVGLSQRAFADKLGITFVTIAYIEQKRTAVMIDTILKACEALGLEIQIVGKEVGN